MPDSTTPETDKPPKASKPVKPPEQPNPNPKGSTKKPPTGGSDAKPKATAKRPPGRPKGLEGQLVDFFTQVGMIITAFNANDGMIIASNAESLGKAWADLAREDQRVKQAIEKMLKGSAWSGVFMATGTVAIGIASNHGVFDGVSLFGGSDESDSETAEAPRTPGEAPTNTGTPPGLWS